MTRTPLSRSKGQRSTCCWCLKQPTCRNRCHLANKYEYIVMPEQRRHLANKCEGIVNLQGRRHIVSPRAQLVICYSGYGLSNGGSSQHVSASKIKQTFVSVN